MRKTLGTVASLLLFAVICVPNTHADSFDASFTCTSSCVSVPIDPNVFFPSPIIPITFDGFSFKITLNPYDTYSDNYAWGSSRPPRVGIL